MTRRWVDGKVEIVCVMKLETRENPEKNSKIQTLPTKIPLATSRPELGTPRRDRLAV